MSTKNQEDPADYTPFEMAVLERLERIARSLEETSATNSRGMKQLQKALQEQFAQKRARSQALAALPKKKIPTMRSKKK